MFWALWLSYFAIPVVTSNIGPTLGTAKICEFEKKHGAFYNPKALQSYGKIIKSINSSEESECRASCCEFSNCTLYMYSTVLHDVNCILISCENKSLCLTKPLPQNVTDISVVGIKQGNFTNTTSMVNSSVTNLSFEQFKTHSPLRSPSINTSFHHISSMKGTTSSNITVGRFTPHYGRISNVIPSSSTNQSQPTTSLYHMLSIVQRRPVHLKSYQTELLTGSYQSTSLDNSVAHETHFTANTLHTFSQLGRNSSPMSLKVMNSSEVFPLSKVHLISSLFSAFANANILSSISRTVIPNPHTRIVDVKSSTVLSQSGGKLEGKPGNKLKKEKVTPGLKSSPPIPTKFPTSSSAVKQNSRRKFSEKHSHTTPVSLVIALIIGVLFFGTVVFLIGRRWSELCFRRGYSRVDYLLNDYD